MKAVTLKNIHFQYEEEGPVILSDVNASIQNGEWIAVIGPNGSGKSTLSRLFNGLLLPQSGDIYINGKSVFSDEDLPSIRREVGMVFQNPDHQFVAPTVRDDIAFGMENAGVPREDMLQRIETVARQTGVEDILDKEPHRLSGGQKQRVAIAGVLALYPSIMVLDEATSMLDPNGKQEVLHTIRSLHASSDVTILSVTHQLHEALMADRVWYMENGRIIYDVTAEKLLNNLNWLQEKNIPLPYAASLYQSLAQKGISSRSLEAFLWREKSR